MSIRTSDAEVRKISRQMDGPRPEITLTSEAPISFLSRLRTDLGPPLGLSLVALPTLARLLLSAATGWQQRSVLVVAVSLAYCS